VSNDFESIESDFDVLVCRCPQCGKIISLLDTADFLDFDDENHVMLCSKCGYKYTVNIETKTTYTATSPERLHPAATKIR